MAATSTACAMPARFMLPVTPARSACGPCFETARPVFLSLGGPPQHEAFLVASTRQPHPEEAGGGIAAIRPSAVSKDGPQDRPTIVEAVSLLQELVRVDRARAAPHLEMELRRAHVAGRADARNRL